MPKQSQDELEKTRVQVDEAHPEPPTQDPMLWLQIIDLSERYIDAIDNDKLEVWPAFFTEDGTYTIVSRENHERGLPAPILKCRNRAMMRDRVLALRNANIYEAHRYRHATGGLVIESHEGDVVHSRMSYIVAWTGQVGESIIYQAGCYHDTVVKTPQGWRYRDRTVVYDTSRVHTLLATPI